MSVRTGPERRLHVVGGGLAGLSAALHGAGAGWRITVHEGAGQPGGRCRSFYDKTLDRVIDNGNHLVLSGNRAVARYLDRAGVPDALTAAGEASFAFVDVKTAERWSVRMNDGLLPWWVFFPRRRPLGVGLLPLLAATRLGLSRAHHAIADLAGGEGPLRDRFWDPMSYAVMNLPPDRASAKLMWRTALLAWRDGRLARPMFAPEGLGHALVDPAVRTLEGGGHEVRLGAPVKSLTEASGRVTALGVDGGEIAVGPHDAVVVALPPAGLNCLFPEADAPTESSAILNVHFVLPEALRPALKKAPPLMGLVGGIAQWIFPRGDVVSLTISASQTVEGADTGRDTLVAALWSETRTALDLPETAHYEAVRVLHEKRATFLQTPENVARRPKPQTRLANLFLAGDVIDNGLPATIEGAIQSGETAARLASARGV